MLGHVIGDDPVCMDQGGASEARTLFPLAGHHIDVPHENEPEDKGSKGAWLQCSSFPQGKVMQQEDPHVSALGGDGFCGGRFG